MRLVATILLDKTQVITTSAFSTTSPVGTLSATLRNLDRWCADEVIVLDTSGNVKNLVSQISQSLSRYMTPLCIGGGIRTINDAALCVKNGADRICIQDLFFTDPSTVTDIVGMLGKQALVLNLSYSVNHGTIRGEPPLSSSPPSLLERLDKIVCEAKNLGIGDILLWSIDNDGIYSNRQVDLEITLSSMHSGTNFIVGGGMTPHIGLNTKIPSNVSIAFGNILYLKENYLLNARSDLLSLGYSLRSL